MSSFKIKDEHSGFIAQSYLHKGHSRQHLENSRRVVPVFPSSLLASHIKRILYEASRITFHTCLMKHEDGPLTQPEVIMISTGRSSWIIYMHQALWLPHLLLSYSSSYSSSYSNSLPTNTHSLTHSLTHSHTHTHTRALLEIFPSYLEACMMEILHQDQACGTRKWDNELPNKSTIVSWPDIQGYRHYQWNVRSNKCHWSWISWRCTRREQNEASGITRNYK